MTEEKNCHIVSGSSNFIQVEACNIQKDQYAMIQGNPCKVTSIHSSLGRKKHIIKNIIFGIDLMTGKEQKETFLTHSYVETFLVKKTDYQLIHISDDGYVTLLLDNGSIREDMKLPNDFPELSKQIKEDFHSEKSLIIQILLAIGKEQISSYREVNSMQS